MGRKPSTLTSKPFLEGLLHLLESTTGLPWNLAHRWQSPFILVPGSQPSGLQVTRLSLVSPLLDVLLMGGGGAHRHYAELKQETSPGTVQSQKLGRQLLPTSCSGIPLEESPGSRQFLIINNDVDKATEN